MLRFITLSCLCLLVAIACEQASKKKNPNGQTNSASIATAEPESTHSPCSGGSVDVQVGVNAILLTRPQALARYAVYKQKILDRDASTPDFCLPGSGSNYKILKCGHFPVNRIEEHICIRETSLKAVYAGYDGIRLYPIEKITSSGDVKWVHFMLVFTKMRTVGSETVYDDMPNKPILLLKIDWLKERICAIGVHAGLHLLAAHRLCTPRCPENADADLLFDY